LRALVEASDYGFQAGFFLAQGLCVLWIAPDIGVFQFEQDLFEFVAFLIVVKDTPGAIRFAI
jgi:hypothetical protein